MLDLRQPHIEDGEDNYRWGWSDVPEKMLYAMFNLLGEYLKEEEDMERFLAKLQKEKPLSNEPRYQEDWEKEFIQRQEEDLQEAKRIHYWWMVERKEAQRKVCAIAKNINIDNLDDPKNRPIFDECHKLEDELEAKTDEMITRLMKIRRTLWT